MRWAVAVIGLLLWAQDGKALFEANCASCHAINRRIVGPALKGTHERWGDEAEIIKFIQNSQAYINGNFKNSAYAKKLYEEYNRAVMTAFTALSLDEIKAILDYIKAESAAAESVPAVSGAAGVGKTTSADEGSASSGVSPMLWVLTIGLGAVALALLITTLVLSRVLRPEKEETGGSGLFHNVGKLTDSPRFWGTAGIIAFLWFCSATIKKARSVGLHKGYQPVQPIAFSHKTHAGEYKIACQYCHIGVEKGKSATFPATNICMNCHVYIQEGSRYGTKEIAKILASYQENKPIEWVRIHNLPDHVYFSHAQHVKVGGIACQTCHGPVEEMEEVYQYSDLSMGWCINCHRQTKVDLTANPYYARLHAYYKEKEVSVEKLGGLECSKCHY